MTQQTINVGTNANDGTGDPLRTAGQKINANFTEVYALAQNAYNQANTATFPDQASFNTANAAFVQANTATTNAATANTRAQSAFDQANTATTNAGTANTTAQSAFDKANTATTNASTANTTAQSAFDQANTATTNAGTANTKAQLAFDKANTVLIDTQSNGIALISNTWSKLQFDPTGVYNPTIIHNGSWLYVDGTGLVFESNTSGNLFSTSIGTTGDLNLSGNVVFSDSSVQTTAVSPYRPTTSTSSPGNIYMALTDEVIFCDPNAAGADINVVLPNPTVLGKVITVKNINTGANVVFVQPGSAGHSMELLSGSVGTGLYETLGTTGNTVTWLWDSGCWRIISSY